MSGVRLSEKHGVNPTLLCCPLRGKDTGVGLLGRLPGDAEAPGRSRDVAPCEECAGYMKQGVLLIGCEGSPEGRRTTGRMVVVKPEAIMRALAAPMNAQVVMRRAAHIDVATFEALGFGKACEATQ